MQSQSARQPRPHRRLESMIDRMDDVTIYDEEEEDDYILDHDYDQGDEDRNKNKSKNSNSRKHRHAGDQSNSFLNYIQQTVTSCGGVVDIASYIMEGHSTTCGSSTNKGANHPPRNRAGLHIPRNPRRRRMEDAATLEFDALPDDVSALSDNTLQEMERLALMRAAMASQKEELQWPYGIARGLSQRSLAISTSGSSSSIEVEYKENRPGDRFHMQS